MNLAQVTEAFSQDDFKDSCLRRFSRKAASLITTHTLPSEIYPLEKVRLVDPKTFVRRDIGDFIQPELQGDQRIDDAVDHTIEAGLFSFSEVIFDPSHNLAAVSYSFRLRQAFVDMGA